LPALSRIRLPSGSLPSNVLRDLVPAVTLFSSLIYAFGSFSVMVFFFVFHRAQQ
jgi:hypothetical protein